MFHSAPDWSTVARVLVAFRNDTTPHVLAAQWSDGQRGELDSAIDYARANGVLALLGARLEEAGCLEALAEPVRRSLCNALDDGAHRAQRDIEERSGILATLSAARIESLVLKGAAFADTLYRRVGVRPTRDFDLLVHRRDIEAARRVFEGLGFAPVPGAAKPGHHLPRMIRPRSDDGGSFAVDVHHRLVPERVYGICVGKLDGVWARAVPLDINSGRYAATLGRTDHVVHMHVHLFHHVFYNFRLMHLVDIVTALREWQDLDWHQVASQLDTLRLREFRRDLWSWIKAFFGDVIAEDVPVDARHRDTGEWLLQLGSLPVLSSLRYTNGTEERARALAEELRRWMWRGLCAPGWSLVPRSRKR